MDIKSCVIYEDDDLVVLNKPGGLLTIPDGYNADLPCVKRALDDLYGRIWTVHRLDKNTSGVLVFAKHVSAHRELNIQFTKHQIHKEYRACVHGFPIWDKKTVDMPLKINGDRHHRTIADLHNGKSARTTFYVLEHTEQACMMQAIPETGLTHQIRAHISLLGFPILGDSLYWRQGNMYSKNNYHYSSTQDRLYLHAITITFKHPTNGKSMVFEASPPEYFHL